MNSKEMDSKEIASKPIIKEDLWGRDFTPIQKYFCSICDSNISINDLYCRHCGRKIDWSE